MNKNYTLVQEGNAQIIVPSGKVSKSMGVFYNPVMMDNRSISVLLLNGLGQKNMQIVLPMEATGVRGIRFAKELKKGIIKSIVMNDLNPDAVSLMKKNIKLNNLKFKIEIKNQDANLFLLNSTGFDYIDIDPFGTPNPFLDSAVRRISRNGILAVTATDTSALCTFESACQRKYWAKPLRNWCMHETGLRILIRKVQLIGAEHERALTPVYSYSKEHYMRVFFRCEKGKKKADIIIPKHKYLLICSRCLSMKTSDYNKETCECKNIFDYAGRLWTGQLWNKNLARRMAKTSRFPELNRFLSTISEEAKISTAGFHDIHAITKRYRIRDLPKMGDIINKIRKLGFSASRTHFSGTGVRTDASVKDLLKLL